MEGLFRSKAGKAWVQNSCSFFHTKTIKMKKLIKVEDDPGILDAFSLVLGSTYQLEMFNSADLILDNQFDVPNMFIIDKQLSGTSGTVLCKHLKSDANTSAIPVALVSASPDIHKVAAEAGADAALEKPFAVKKLREIVTGLLDRP
ncbi:MAG: response regulator [Chitinophagaceae bacterium]|nr:MAG: response regulator [Chitinophagaceae bacterium]